jgi:general stress protein CsbA
LIFNKWVAIFIILFALLALFNNSLSTVFLIIIIAIVSFIVIRLLADLFWFGKKRGDW